MVILSEFQLLHHVWEIIMHSSCILDPAANLLIRHMVFEKSPFASYLKSLDRSRVQLSQTLRKVDKTSVRISWNLEPSEMFLSL